MRYRSFFSSSLLFLREGSTTMVMMTLVIVVLRHVPSQRQYAGLRAICADTRYSSLSLNSLYPYIFSHTTNNHKSLLYRSQLRTISHGDENWR